MADITWAQARDQWRAAVHILDEYDLFANANSPNFVSLEESMIDILSGDAAGRITTELAKYRSALSGRLTPEAVRAFLTPIYQDLMSAIGETDRGFQRNAVALRDYMQEQSHSVKARDLTFATPAAGGSNVGDGNIYRLTVDKDGNELQGGVAEAVTLICVQDQISVEEFEEVFEYRGARAGKDFAKLGGSGLKKLIASLSAQQAENYLRNPSFDVYGGATQPVVSTPVTPTATTSVTGWVLGSTADFEVSVDEVARGAPSVTVPKSLVFVDNGNVSQVLQDNVAPRIPRPDDFPVPNLLAPSLERLTSCDGTLTMRLGSQSRGITVSGLTNDLPTRQTLDLDSSLYYANWREQDADVRFELASRTTGKLAIDDVMLTPMVLINGLWYAVIGGPTSWLLDDLFAWTDTEGTRAKMQYWSSYRTGLSTLLGWAYTLPSDAMGYETVTDPS